MEALSDVTIVSVFGRGQWLAGELKAKGYDVEYVDTSQAMGPWGAEDWEGPFGYFDTVGLRASQRTWLVQDEEVLPVAKGFCIWLKSGPLEFKSSLTDYLLRSHNIAPAIEEYLRAESGEQQSALWEQLIESPFKESWLAHLAHQAFSTVYMPNHEAMKWAPPLPIFSPFHFRRAARVGKEKGLQVLRDQGIKVHSPAKVVDVLVQDRQIRALEVEGEPSRVLKSKVFLWLITSEETRWFSQRLKEKLYPKGSLKPTWYWTRFRFEIPQEHGELALPAHFAIVEDKQLSWSHDNFVLALKTAIPSQYDMWLRLPLHYRFQTLQHMTYREKIADLLHSRLPGARPTCVQMPQEHHYSEDQVGAPLFPVYDLMVLERFRPARLKNVFLSGPEHWPRHDWGSQLNQQVEVLQAVEDYLQNLAQGETGRDRQIHP